MTDPLEGLRRPDEPPIRPRTGFVSELRGRLAGALGLDADDAVPAVALPPRRSLMPPSAEPATRIGTASFLPSGLKTGSTSAPGACVTRAFLPLSTSIQYRS